MAGIWKSVEDEALAADITTTKWVNAGTGATITETNEQGLRYTYERIVIATDGVNVEPQAATICYGFAESYADHLGLDRWLGLVAVSLPLSSFTKSGVLSMCDVVHEGYTCDQMLHAGQVRLGNEDCDGCAPCSYVEVFR
jgi:hypothetical protein